MNISIDESVLEKISREEGQKITQSELLTCMIILLGDNPIDVTNNLLDRGVVIRDLADRDKLYVFSDYKGFVERVIAQSIMVAPAIEGVEELTTKLQELFPKEKKCDSCGIPKYAYRGNKRDVTKRLQKFFNLYGKYSYEDVLECTKRYVASFKYDKTYMKILPYFILKDGESQLATELENIDTENTDTNFDTGILL